MDYLRKHKKRVLGIIVFILYFIISDLMLNIIVGLGIDVRNSSDTTKQIMSILINLCYPILLIIFYHKDLINDFKKIKKNYSEYLESAITYYAIGLIGMVVINYILCYILKLGIAGNEESIRNLIEKTPIYMFASACIIAPFQEEMVFRKAFKDIFKYKIPFIIFSGLIFGAMHVIGNFTTYTDILFLLPYGFLGSMFALIYEKTDNILVPVCVHLIHNTALVLIQILL